MDSKQPDTFRKGSSIKGTLSMFTQNLTMMSGPKSAGPKSRTNGFPKSPKAEKQDRIFVSLYERTMALIAKLYSLPDFEFYLFPDGVDALLQGDSVPVIDPIAILWHCFRLGAPLCHLLNLLQPKTLLDVPDVSGLTTYTNICKKCIYKFLIEMKNELKIPEEELFSISDLYKDDTNGLVKIIEVVNMVLDEMENRGIHYSEKSLPFATGLSGVERSDNRSRALSELLTTERKYIESLQELLVKHE
jgi:cell division control protein 24